MVKSKQLWLRESAVKYFRKLQNPIENLWTLTKLCLRDTETSSRPKLEAAILETTI